MAKKSQPLGLADAGADVSDRFVTVPCQGTYCVRR